jgi:hypothetical protein
LARPKEPLLSFSTPKFNSRWKCGNGYPLPLIPHLARQLSLGLFSPIDSNHIYRINLSKTQTKMSFRVRILHNKRLTVWLYPLLHQTIDVQTLHRDGS